MVKPDFSIARADGRSNSQVLLDLFKDGEPGRVYSFGELSATLEEGTDKRYPRAVVRTVITSLYRRLLKEQCRAVHNVRNVGYRLAEAKEHGRLAHDRKRRADVQLLKGLDTLRHVRWEEMDPQARAAHEAHLMIHSALYEQQKALERRQDAVEGAIAKLMNK